MHKEVFWLERGVRFDAIVEYARSSLWVLPSISVCAAIVLGALLPDIEVPDEAYLNRLLFPGGPEGARGMLQAVASSVITVTSLTFSLTVVTLQLASSQFSPRLLRTFLRQPGNQVVLSVFLATFVYSLVVLRAIQDGDEEFVPAMAVSVAFLLVLASVAALVYFIHHITSEIRADTLMQRVEEDTIATIEHVHPDKLDLDTPIPAAPTIPQHAVPIPCTRAGLVQAVGAHALAEVASEHNAVIVLTTRSGDRVVRDATFAWAWCVDPSQTLRVEQLADAVNAAVTVGHERTLQQDVNYGIRQLVDMGVKAMSPSVNDPMTATDATGHIASILSVLAGRQVMDVSLHDRDGVLRVYWPRHQFADYLQTACRSIGHYGCEDPDVMIALLDLLRDVGGATVTPEQREAVEAEFDIVVSTARDGVPRKADLQRVIAAADRTRLVIQGARPVAIS